MSFLSRSTSSGSRPRPRAVWAAAVTGSVVVLVVLVGGLLPILGLIGAADGATAGAAISAVSGGGPAADAGLRGGDVITAFDGKAVSDSNGLVAAIAAHKPGDQVKVTVKRGSGTEELTVTLGTQPAQRSSDG